MVGVEEGEDATLGAGERKEKLFQNFLINTDYKHYLCIIFGSDLKCNKILKVRNYVCVSFYISKLYQTRLLRVEIKEGTRAKTKLG